MSDATRDAIAAGILELTRQATTPPEPWRYGRDLVCIDDLTPTLRETDPDTNESLAQDLYHRITTASGTLPDDKDWGVDVRDYLSHALTYEGLLLIGSTLEGEIRKDDRVRDVVATADGTPESLNIEIVITPEDPSLAAFSMILAVTSSAALLEAIR